MGCCEENECDEMECCELQVGQIAPSFDEDAYINGQTKRIKSSDFKGKWIVLFFYPLDFTFVCPTEIKGFQQHLSEFEKLNSVVVGCSTDSVHSHKAWFQRDMPEVKFPVIADNAHRVSRNYAVLIEEDGMFVEVYIDENWDDNQLQDFEFIFKNTNLLNASYNMNDSKLKPFFFEKLQEIVVNSAETQFTRNLSNCFYLIEDKKYGYIFERETRKYVIIDI